MVKVKKETILFGVFIQLLLAFGKHIPENATRKLSIAKQKEILMEIINLRWEMENSTSLNGNSDGGGANYRRPLPPEDRLFKEDFPPLECGATYALSQEGYLYFDLKTGKKQCWHSLLGSVNEECTVAVYCDGDIQLGPQTGRGCEKEYLVLTDGTVGLMSGCGAFNFEKMPRIAKNGGRDLYVFIKGHDPNAKCVAFCKEDMKTGYYGLQEPEKIENNEEFNGIWTETHCQCGMRGNSGRVVGGDEAFHFEFPWMVSLVYAESRQPFCGGSLINDRYVLSAAHCFGQITANDVDALLHAHVMDKHQIVEDAPLSISQTPGWNLTDETDWSEHSVRRIVSEIRVHPLYQKKGFDYDYALLKLDQPVNMINRDDHRVIPICLPFVGETIKYQDDEFMTVAGWGVAWERGPATSRILEKVDLPYLNRRTCRQYTRVNERQICAGFLEGGKDSCTGDSGGPLMSVMNSEYDQQLRLAGIVSHGAGCARENKLGKYSDVREAAQWIYFNTPGAVWCSRFENRV